MKIASYASQGTGSSGTQKGRRGRPRRSGATPQVDHSDSDGISMNDVPIETNGVVSVCDIELLTEEDKAIPDSKLASYNIEEEFVGFGVGLSACLDRFPQQNGSTQAGGAGTGIRLCYSGLWRKLPQNIPVRELAMSRYHIAVLLNNGHVYVTLNDMNENLSGSLESLQRTAPGATAGSQQQQRPESGNEQRNSINSSNTLLLGASVSQGAWLNIKELDDKSIRGLRITSVATEMAYDAEHRLGVKSFVLACLTNDGKIWIVEHCSSLQGGFNSIRHIDLTQLSPGHQEGERDKSGSDFCRAVDITLSEITPVSKRGFDKSGGGRVEEVNECHDVLLFEDFPSFPYRYGIAITSLLADGQSNSIILKKSTEIGHHDKMEVLDLPVICKKIFCGFNADFGMILLQNGVLWSWDRRMDQQRPSEQDHDSGRPHISIRMPGRPPEEEGRSAGRLCLRVLRGSLSERKVIDFSGLNGEFIALTQDGVIHEWNDPDRLSVFKRPLIKDPLILTPKTNHFIVKRALSNGGYWSLDSITSKCVRSSPVEEDLGDDVLREMMNKEIESMYSSDNKIIGAWLLEGVTLILYRDGVLKALYNYLGRDGYDTKVGFISEEDELCWSKRNSSINSCILLSSRLGRCIPANPIALVGLLSNFGQSKSLPDRQKQLIIQRSLVKLSLREKPVYRILACYNSIIFGILRPNPKWRPGRSQSCSKVVAAAQVSKCLGKSNSEEMNLSATVNLNSMKEIIQSQESKEDTSPNALLSPPPGKDANAPSPLPQPGRTSSFKAAPPSEETQAATNKGRETGNRKQPSSRKGSGSVGAASNTAASASAADAFVSTDDSPVLSVSFDSPPGFAEESDKTKAREKTPARCRTSKHALLSNRLDSKPDQLSASVPPGSNKRSHNTKTRKRERRSLPSSENKENSNSTNNLDGQGYLYYTEKEEDNNFTRETKKLSLAEYEVEQILSIREKPLTKQKEYLIKWKVPGHPVQPTWEPEENLNGCEELLQEFLKSIKTSRSGRLLLPCTTALNKIV